MRFYLGTHMTNWLATANVPLFVSHRRLRRYRRSLPVAIAPWALDSGGFTELEKFGEWRTTPAEYVDAVARYHAEIGRMEWAAPMDWMCEPKMLAKTGLTVEAHQQRTVENYLLLRQMAPALPFVPVLQGWTLSDYEAHARMYETAGVDLTAERLVGIGSVCRRQGRDGIPLVNALGERFALHGFGFKLQGVRRCSHRLASADSMAWSYNARLNPPLPGCTHQSCANCLRWALRWRQRLLASIETQQLSLSLGVPDVA